MNQPPITPNSQTPNMDAVLPPGAAAARVQVRDDFIPSPPKTLRDAKLHQNDLFPLVLKFLFLHGPHSGSRISNQIKLPYPVVEPVLAQLKNDLMIGHKGSSGVNDYVFELSPKGVEQAKIAMERSSYCGAAPVSLNDYKNAVLQQSVKDLRPTFDDVAGALQDLSVTNLQVSQLGQAINSGRSLFLFGQPGNGKTSIATRAIRACSKVVWIPRSITIGGEVVRMFDPSLHEPAPLQRNSSITNDFAVDERWIRIQRPSIVVGGELTLDALEATLNPVTGIIEAPIHVKSNCGCLIVDDFGRQQISPTELLNRWIVPMEMGHDYLNLPSGRQIQLPFEQLLIFSTNLEPRTLCDEAFLRRIPYKVEVFDPTEGQFRELFEKLGQKMGFQIQPGIIDYLIEYHYKRVNRPFRFCHPLDLLNQAKDFCEFHRKPLVFNRDIVEISVLNYFSGMTELLND